MTVGSGASSGRFRPLADLLFKQAGGYLRNPVWSLVTCQVCATPVAGYARCFPCSQHRATYGTALAQRTAFLTYAINGEQSATTLTRYKLGTASARLVEVIRLLAAVGLLVHRPCLDQVSRNPVTHWATVPSLHGRSGVHPIRQAAGPFAPGRAIDVRPTTSDGSRAIEAAKFVVPPLSPNSHLLVIDDTWTTGANAQSLALAARRAGAAEVSVLVLARWLNPLYGANRGFVSALPRPFDVQQCPWLRGPCPAGNGIRG